MVPFGKEKGLTPDWAWRAHLRVLTVPRFMISVNYLGLSTLWSFSKSCRFRGM